MESVERMMAMVPIKKILAHRANYGTKRAGAVEWIVMHYTANDGDSGASNGKYFQQALNPVASAHYFVDDKSITISVPEDYVAYHCGADKYRHPFCRNYNSIGIEMCDTKRDGRVMATDRTIANAADLAAMLCERYGLPVSHIIRHYDVTGKLCPKYWVDDPLGIVKFREMVKERVEMVTKAKMIVDGREIEVERILKNGTNYIKIRDIATALDLKVSNQGNIPVLESKK